VKPAGKKDMSIAPMDLTNSKYDQHGHPLNSLEKKLNELTVTNVIIPFTAASYDYS
jgi:hypothetical protein